MIKLKKIIFEMPHVEYLDGSLIDFQIEKYKISMELKMRLLKTFKEVGVVAFSKKENKWLYISVEEKRVATQKEIEDRVHLPDDWEDYVVEI